MAYRLKYRFEDLANPNPQANNSLSPEGLYYERSFYDEVAYPSHIRKGLDTWSGRVYYGKINQGQDTIVPGPANLDIISSADGYHNVRFKLCRRRI